MGQKTTSWWDGPREQHGVKTVAKDNGGGGVTVGEFASARAIFSNGKHQSGARRGSSMVKCKGEGKRSGKGETQ